MKKDKRVPKTVAAKDAVFVYISVCCGAGANKPACVVAKGQRIGEYIGAKPEGEATLGRWRCSSCGKVAKVNRANKPKPEETNV